MQHQLASGTEVDLGYVGTFGTHSDSVRNINQPLPGGGYDFNSRPEQRQRHPEHHRSLCRLHQYQYARPGRRHRLQRTAGPFAAAELPAVSSGKISYTYSKTMTDSNRVWRDSAKQLQSRARNGASPLTIDVICSWPTIVYSLPFFVNQRNLVGEALGGWQWTGIVNLQGGTPL